MSAARTHGQWWGSDGPTVRARLTDVERVGEAAFEAAGASPEDARFLLRFTLDKALQGDHARGLRRLPRQLAAAREGRVDLAPTVEVLAERDGAALLDGGPAADGRLVCRAAMALAIEKARRGGVGWVSARAAGEILGVFAAQAAEQGLVGVVLSQSPPTVAPLGGFEPLLGNAPLAIAVPSDRHDPILLDMSLTRTSASGVLLAAEQRQRVAPGLLLDERGEPTTNAASFPDAAAGEGPAFRGSLAPLAPDHKGYALLFAVSLLASALTASAPSWSDAADARREGTVLLALDPSTVAPPANFTAAVDDYVECVKRAPRRPGVEEILYPGELSQRLRRRARERGELELPQDDFEAICALARELGLPRVRAAHAVENPDELEPQAKERA